MKSVTQATEKYCSRVGGWGGNHCHNPLHPFPGSASELVLSICTITLIQLYQNIKSKRLYETNVSINYCLIMKNESKCFSGLSKPDIQFTPETKQVMWHVDTALSCWKQILEHSHQNGDKTCYCRSRDADSCIYIAIAALAAVNIAVG